MCKLNIPLSVIRLWTSSLGHYSPNNTTPWFSDCICNILGNTAEKEFQNSSRSWTESQVVKVGNYKMITQWQLSQGEEFGGRKKKWVNWIMRYKLPVIKELILEDIMYSIIAKGGRG